MADPSVASWTPINMWAMLRALINNGCPIVTFAGAPVSGTSGTFAGQCGKGSILLDFTNGNFYQNAGTLASPTWNQFATGGGFVQYQPFANTAAFLEFTQGAVTAGSTQTQAGATALTGQTVEVTTVTTLFDGVALPASQVGLEMLVINHGANAMKVYPFNASGDKIDDQAANAAVVQMANSLVIYTCAVAGQWYTEGLATGFGGPGLQTLSDTPTITANATQTQAAATKLVSMINRIGTCATQGNGVALPTSAVGLEILVINRGAQPCQVYGDNTEAATINGIATGTGISMGVNTAAVFTCSVAGNWEVPIASLIGTSPVAITANGAIAPHVSHTYVITKAGVAAMTLAAPTTGTDDGNIITIASSTANAHTITATGLLQTGSAAVNVATFNALAGASLTLMAYLAKWIVLEANGVSFS